MDNHNGTPANPNSRVFWIVIGVVFAALLLVRGFTGTGIGREYVTLEKQSFVQVEVPAVFSEEAEAATDTWVAADSEDAARYPRVGDRTIEWTESRRADAGAAFRAQAAGLTAADGAPVYSFWRTLGLWVAAFFTLAIFSFLYRDNPYYKVAEAIVVGVSAAYWMVVGFWDTLIPNLVGKLMPDLVKAHFLPGLKEADTNWFYLVPLALGVMLVWRLAPKGGWISLWPLAFIMGTTAGLRLVGYIESDLLSQLREGIVPLVVFAQNADGSTDLPGSIYGSLGNILLVVGVLCCLTYFFFSIEHKGVVGRAARVGIWYLMITFGAAFGFTVMGRIALLAARIEFLFDDWLWLIDPKEMRTVEAVVSSLLTAQPF